MWLERWHEPRSHLLAPLVCHCVYSCDRLWDASLEAELWICVHIGKWLCISEAERSIGMVWGGVDNNGKRLIIPILFALMQRSSMIKGTLACVSTSFNLLIFQFTHGKDHGSKSNFKWPCGCLYQGFTSCYGVLWFHDMNKRKLILKSRRSKGLWETKCTSRWSQMCSTLE